MIEDHHTTYEILQSIVEDIVNELVEDAKNKLIALINTNLDGAVEEDALYLIFAAALSKKIGLKKEEEINIYLQKHPVSQIELFNLLTTQLPLASLPGKLANHVLCNYIGTYTEITLLEIGIGTGRQTILLLDELLLEGTLPARITIYAIEPDKENLLIAQQNLQQVAHRCGVELIFHPIHSLIEDLEDSSWKLISSITSPLFVNAAFALHHIGASDRNIRKQVLRKIYQCAPVVFVLCEPNSDHYTNNFEVRFTNCWNHFRSIFNLIQQLDISKKDKVALKLFFSREIEDIIGNNEGARYERHETLISWGNQLQEAGFTLITNIEIPTQENALLTIVKEEQFLGIKYKDEIIVGTIIAIPKESFPDEA